MHSLIADLATLARNTVTAALAPENRFTLLTRPTQIQHAALRLGGTAQIIPTVLLDRLLLVACRPP